MTNVWACLPEPGKGSNIGTLLRTCDAFGCGLIVAAQPNIEEKLRHGSRLPKEQLPAVKFIPDDRDLQIQWLQERAFAGAEIIGLECSDTAIPMRNYLPTSGKEVILMGGHERKGIPNDLLRCCHHVLCLPQEGFDLSMNIIVAMSIGLAKIQGFV